MSKLFVLENMGFRVTWKLLMIGLIGENQIPQTITQADIIEYLESSLVIEDEQVDNKILLICEKDSFKRFVDILKKFASLDGSDASIQKRKWRAFLLKELLDDISKESIRGMLELIEFWVTMGSPTDCPMTLPCCETQNSIANYFTEASYNNNIRKNRKWLEEEVSQIIKLEI